MEKETNWVNELSAGNEDALAHFFKLHHHSLCYFAGKLVQDIPQAEDIVAECFVKLWERRENFDHPEKLKAFLYISCRNNCLKYLRDLKRKTAAQDLYYKQLDENSEEILYEIIDTEIVDILAGEIEGLPEKCRDVFKLLYFEGKKTDEIALLLNLSVQTVRNHKTRAIEMLRAQFLKKGLSGTLQLAFLFFIDRHL
ncbi:RNA polymerase sigma factor [Pedobacter sp. PWIIR3]